MSELTVTPRTTITRHAERARTERALLHQVLDEALLCHVGFIRDGHPVVIPTIHARIDDVLYLHGSTGSGWLNALRDGAEVCVSATVVDALVLARAAAQHSANYRSVVAYGRCTVVDDPAEKMASLRALTDHVLEGRWDEVLPPSAKKLAATLVLRLPLDEASVKVRTGPPMDEEAALSEPIWAGELPLEVRHTAPVADGRLATGITPGPSVLRALS